MILIPIPNILIHHSQISMQNECSTSLSITNILLRIKDSLQKIFGLGVLFLIAVVIGMVRGYNAHGGRAPARPSKYQVPVTLVFFILFIQATGTHSQLQQY